MGNDMIFFFLWIATQIIGESFPISSSSHLRLLECLLFNYKEGLFLENLPHHFDDFLHGATLLVLACFFWPRWSVLLMHYKKTARLLGAVVMRTMIASVITVLFYLFFSMMPSVIISIQLGLLITAFSLFSLVWPDDEYQSYTMGKAVILGIVQGLSLLPGISRLGSTYVAARWLKLSPRHSLEASFAMQVPLIIAAFFRSVIFLYKSGMGLQLLNVQTGLVMLVSTIIAYYCLCLVSSMARNNRLWWVSFYMLLPIISSYVLKL